MNKNNILDTIDKLKNRQYLFLDGLVLDRICNYIEANIDEFIECYDEVKR